MEATKDFWDARWAVGDRLRADETEKLSAILDILPVGVGSILDVGCGAGWMLAALRSRCEWAVGLDISLEGLKHVDSAKAMASGTNLPFPNGSFDLILCAEVLEHYRDAALETAVSELARVSRERVLVTVPFEEKRLLNMVCCERCLTEFHSSLHMRSFREGDVAALFRPHGFTMTAVRKTGRESYRSERVARLNAALTGYHSFWRPRLRCPVCGNGSVHHTRAREHTASLALEGINWVLRQLVPAKPHNLCVLLEKGPRSGVDGE